MRGRAIVPGIVLIALLPPAALEPASETVDGKPASQATRSAKPRPLTTPRRIRLAQRFARKRMGHVAFAVLQRNERPRGLHRTMRFRSASVVKAMLMVAVLRRAGRRRVSSIKRAYLHRMIALSDNDAANFLYAQVGGRGLRKVARAARMRRFVEVGHWAEAWITAADQARFFLRIDRLVPRPHHRYARKLLSSVVSWQRWGIARVARRRHMKVFFKGGWRAGILHQAALLERGKGRIGLAVLTNGSPSEAYARETMERIAARVLRPPKKNQH
jgi:Beta-lactamase enzyme family